MWQSRIHILPLMPGDVGWLTGDGSPCSSFLFIPKCPCNPHSRLRARVRDGLWRAKGVEGQLGYGKKEEPPKEPAKEQGEGRRKTTARSINSKKRSHCPFGKRRMPHLCPVSQARAKDQEPRTKRCVGVTFSLSMHQIQLANSTNNPAATSPLTLMLPFVYCWGMLLPLAPSITTNFTNLTLNWRDNVALLHFPSMQSKGPGV